MSEKTCEALTWYAEMAKQMQKACLHMDNQHMLHLMKELALDGGNRANTALKESLTAESVRVATTRPLIGKPSPEV